MEDIHDPHNAAAVLRSAEALGFQKVYFIFEQEEKFNPRQVGKSSSSSANKWLDFKSFSSTREALNELKEGGYKIVATVIDKKAKSIYETSFCERKMAICFGNEHRGLSDTAKKMADTIVCIPMEGMVQSLNLSVTAAIFMYEISRQRRGFGREKFVMDEEARKELEERLINKQPWNS